MLKKGQLPKDAYIGMLIKWDNQEFVFSAYVFCFSFVQLFLRALGKDAKLNFISKHLTNKNFNFVSIGKKL